MSNEIWEKWLKHWDLPEVQLKSEKARQNRMSEPAGEGSGPSCHTGGSRSFVEHWLDMVRK